MTTVSTTKGTAVQIVMAVRSESSGLTAASHGGLCWRPPCRLPGAGHWRAALKATILAGNTVIPTGCIPPDIRAAGDPMAIPAARIMYSFRYWM